MHPGTRVKVFLALALAMVMVLPPVTAAVPFHVRPDDATVQKSLVGPVAPQPRAATNPYLTHAEAAARWLISIALQPAPGQYKWYISDLYPSLYYTELSEGAAGIGAFFMQLYTVTGNATYLKYAEGAARWIISTGVTTAPNATKWPFMEGYPGYQPDLFGGAAAVGQYLLDLTRATGNQTYLTYSKRAANWIISMALPENGGFKWELDPGRNFTSWAHGAAGISDYLMDLWKATGNTTYRNFGEGGARWLISIANKTVPNQYGWVRIQTDKNDDLSWCGGTTGIVMFFIRMYERTGNATYLQYAKGGGNWMIAQATSAGPGKSYFFYLNMFCHGDPSSSYVLFMLYNATHNGTYLRYAEESANWTISTGVKVSNDEMKWPSIIGMNTYETSLLRGVAGIGHQMLYAYNVTKDKAFLGYARKAANWLCNVSIVVSPGVEKWNWEEELGTDKEFLPGWYWGAAGIGTFLLEAMPFYMSPAPPTVYGVDMVGGDLEGHARPGENATYVVTINNTGNTQDNITLASSAVPTGWNVHIDFNGTDIPAGGSRNVTIDVTTPSMALANENATFALMATSVGNSSKIDMVNITTTVDAVRGVDLPSGFLMGHARPGNVTEFQVRVNNTGNAVDNIVLSNSTPPKGWAVNIAFNGTAVPARAQVLATVSVTIPSVAEAKDSWHMTLTARSVGDPLKNDTMTLITSVDQIYKVALQDNDLEGNATPGQTVSYNVTVYNNGNGADDIAMTNPPVQNGWTVQIAFNGTDIPGRGLRNATVNITPPAGALAGSRYILVLNANSRTDPNAYDTMVITTTVQHVPGMRVSGPSGQSALPGRNVTYVFNITNTGNLGAEYLIEVSSAKGWPVKALGLWPGNRTGSVDANRTTGVQVQVTVPMTALAYENDTITFVARSSGASPLNGSASVRTTALAVKDLFAQAETQVSDIRLPKTAIPLYILVKNTGNIDLTVVVTAQVTGPAAAQVTLLNMSSGSQSVTIAMKKEVRIGLLFNDTSKVNGTFLVRIVLKGDGIEREVDTKVIVESEIKTTTEPNPVWLYAAIISIVALVSVVLIGLLLVSRKKQAQIVRKGPKGKGASLKRSGRPGGAIAAEEE